MTLTIGIDVGGTKIAGGVVDEDGTILAESRVESPARSVEHIEEAIVSLVTGLAATHPVEAVGVGAAGYVDAGRAKVLFAPNLAWRDLDLRGDLERRIGLPVVVENDANAAAWGEFRYGAGRDSDDLLLLTVGTGVGGGIVWDGRLMRGAFGVAAEVGHVQMTDGGPLCGCGKRGHLEVYASGSALVRSAREAAATLPAKDLLDRAGGDPEAIEGPMITELAETGDDFCLELLDRLGTWLGRGMASLVAVLDPSVIVVGGGVSKAGDLLLAPARTAFEAELSGRGHRPVAEVRPATLGNRAGMVGAADLARLR